MKVRNWNAIRFRRTWFWWVLAVAVAAWLLWMTLRPNPNVTADLSPLTDSAARQGISTHLLIDVAGNITVFIPLGITLIFALEDGSVWRRLLLTTLVGASLSLGIELVQTTIPTRVAALDDLMLNAIGTAIGALAGWGLQTGLRKAGVCQ